jgi:hypothetical protein
MELAIPLIAFGGMYMISNQPNTKTPSNNCNKNVKNNKSEAFSGLGIAGNPKLPNTTGWATSYPITSNSDVQRPNQSHANATTATADFFNQNAFKNAERQGHSVGSNINQIYSVSDEMNDESFSHNNMVPFTGGSKERLENYGDITGEGNTAILDRMTGAGSYNIKKTEPGPLTRPSKDLHWIHGEPNRSDFMQERVNLGNSLNGVLPFEPQKVAPGLNQGFTTTGGNYGFHTGLNAREAYMPKTVDELRIATNPKMTYDISDLPGPANSVIKKSATIETQGRVEKRRPDTYFENTSNRWLTTTGAVQGNTLRPIQEKSSRTGQQLNYMGPAGATAQHVGPASQTHIPSRRNNLGVIAPMPNAVGNQHFSETSNPLDSFNMRTNNRVINQNDTCQNGIRSGLVSGFTAAMAPFMDVLKPTRKEDVVSNMRIYGDAGSSVPRGYVQNTSVPATSLKETTLYTPPVMINNTQNKGSYNDEIIPPPQTLRDKALHSYTGGAGNSTGSVMVYDSAYKQSQNEIKSSTIYGRTNQGGTQVFTPNINPTILPKDTSPMDGRINGPNLGNAFHRPKPLKRVRVNDNSYNNTIQNDRNDPAILDAYWDNPYSHNMSKAF